MKSNSPDVILAIVGSRRFTDYKVFTYEVEKVCDEWNIFGKVVSIVSGGCQGVDKLAERLADDHDITMNIFRADWDKYGTKAGPMRNDSIVKNCTHLIALVDEKSKGTWDSINKAKKEGKIYEVVYV
jgi:YspA, cpYpsA-related SLOG family